MRIRSIRPGSHYAVCDDGGVYNRRTGKRLKPFRGDARGHLRVSVDGGRRPYVHQLVAEAFIGPTPDGMEVRHLNGAYNDNRLSNLAYGTRAQNVADSIAHGTYRNANGEKKACPRGHVYDSANTYRDPSGRRRCRQCRRNG